MSEGMLLSAILSNSVFCVVPKQRTTPAHFACSSEWILDETGNILAEGSFTQFHIFE